MTVVTLAVLSLGWLWQSALPSVAYYWLLTRPEAGDANRPSLDLPGYVADIQHRPIAGLKDNVSGVAYSPETGTLFAVINRRPEVAELSLDGKLLRRIPIDGGNDPEDITHVAGNQFIIVEEGDQSLHWVRIGPDTETIALGMGPRLRLNYGAFDNFGFEGVSWDAKNERLFVVQEMLPLRVLTIDGLEQSMALNTLDLDVQQWKSDEFSSFFTQDLSAVSLHQPTGNLLLLSQMSAMLVEYAPDGEAIGMMALQAGMSGLTHTVPQAEGVAVAPDGTIFIVSEPNLFYRFRPPPRT
ncbi:SdiA-regulated domain-containing protein [Rhizobium halophytocola]|uniref:Uncharacterized protein YjiK n=1 Tax=Rhizobium halophytocola TaxID=735519 RepID=A0ABS4DSZ7_9HYPH|nr:SdiA-regulated domain-containing protein [Rhizobium halophytocola]MBP1848821.1 uncharacterized protein YjiK [Rhizobium halophytocola]